VSDPFMSAAPLLSHLGMQVLTRISTQEVRHNMSAEFEA